MMPIELTQIVAVVSCVIAAIALFRNVRNDTRSDQGEMTTVIVKLETINETTKEIKNDIKDVKQDMERLKERLVIVEQSTKSAHKRLDSLDKEGVHEAD